MARKKKESPAQIAEDIKLDEIIGRYIDPTNEQAVMIDGTRVIVNITQVAREHLAGLAAELELVGATLLEVDHHPSESITPEEAEA